MELSKKQKIELAESWIDDCNDILKGLYEQKEFYEIQLKHVLETINNYEKWKSDSISEINNLK